MSDKTFVFKDASREYTFTISYPSVKRVSDFYTKYIMSHKINKDNKEQQETNINFEYVNLYIKDVTIKNTKTGDTKTIKFDDYGPLDVTDILSVFPYEVIYNDDGVLQFITKKVIGNIND